MFSCQLNSESKLEDSVHRFSLSSSEAKVKFSRSSEQKLVNFRMFLEL